MIRLPHFAEEARSELADKLEDGRLRCPHCGLLATPEKAYGATARHVGGISRGNMLPTQYGPTYTLAVAVCAGCGQHAVFVRCWDRAHSGTGDPAEVTAWHKRVQPIGRATKPFPNTPADLAKSYEAACSTVEISPEASACMSRRCLQGVLTSQGYKQKDLVEQIKALLTESDPTKRLPSGLHETVDFIRNFGNFGAHQINDIATLQIIPVEPGEAEWCIGIAEQLMEHYFEEPVRRSKMIAAANAKLTSAGKPVAKG